jgi:hypothetical protein
VLLVSCRDASTCGGDDIASASGVFVATHGAGTAWSAKRPRARRRDDVCTVGTRLPPLAELDDGLERSPHGSVRRPACAAFEAARGGNGEKARSAARR